MRGLEAGHGVGGGLYLMRVIFDSGSRSEGDVYREVRYLMLADGSKKGRFLRMLEPGEVVPGLDNPPWLRVGEDES